MRDSFDTENMTEEQVENLSGQLESSINNQIRDIEIITEMIKDSKKDVVLDLGCGTGRIAFTIVNKYPDIHQMIAFDREKRFWKNTYYNARLEFIKGNCEVLPFEDNSIDIVFCRYLFQHLRKATDVLKEIFRVLRQDGELYIIDVDKKYDYFSCYPPNYYSFKKAELLCKKMLKNDVYIGSHFFL